MTIASALTALNQDIQNARTAIVNKGGTVTSGGGSSQLATDIATIPSGSSGIGIPREVKNGVYQMPTESFTFSLPSDATDLGNYALYYSFYNSDSPPSILELDLSSLTSITGNFALYCICYQCISLNSIDLSNLASITGNKPLYRAFYGCSGLTGTLNLSSLLTVTGNSGASQLQQAFMGCNFTNVNLSNLTTVVPSLAFSGCFQNNSNLSQVDFSKLTQIGENDSSGRMGVFGSCFNGTKVYSITFPELTRIYCTGSGSSAYGTFNSNTTLQKLYFPKLNTITYGNGASSTYQNACKYIFSGCSSLTEIHFGAANQVAIEATAGYSTLWGRGAGNATVYFDL